MEIDYDDGIIAIILIFLDLRRRRGGVVLGKQLGKPSTFCDLLDILPEINQQSSQAISYCMLHVRKTSCCLLLIQNGTCLTKERKIMS